MEGPLSAKVPSARHTHADELNSDHSRSRISALKCNSFFFVLLPQYVFFFCTMYITLESKNRTCINHLKREINIPYLLA